MALLSGLTVLEVSGSLAAQIAAGLLTDLGADVLILEPPAGSSHRSRPGFRVWSRGKQSLVAGDICVRARELAPGFDVLLVDEPDWESAGRPRAARATAVISVFGDVTRPSTPGSAAAAPALAEALSGLDNTQQGWREGPFYIVEEPAAFGTGALAAIGVLAALYANAADETELVRVSHLQGALGMLLFSAVTSPDAPLTAIPIDGDPKRVTTPLIRFHRALDGWIVIGAVSPSLFAKVCVALELPELLGDPRYVGAPFRIPDPQARIEIVERMAAKIATRTADEWIAHFRASGVIAGRLLAPGDGLDDPQVEAIGMRLEVDDPETGKLVQPGRPIADGTLAAAERLVAPPLDRHDPALLARVAAGQAGPRVAPRRRSPPLSGVRVADFATMAAGPGTSRMLAGMGAEVVKVEAPEGDPMRPLGFSFCAVNRGKHSVALNLQSEEARARAQEIVAGASVVVHNLRPAVAARSGLTPPELLALNPTLVECAVSGYGPSGPDADLPSIDVVFESLVGAPLVQGGGDEPVGFAGGLVDNGTTLLSTVGTLAAMYSRRRENGPRRVETSLLATTMYRHADLLVRPLSQWRSVLLGPDPDGPSAAQRLYRCADGWILLAAASAADWIRAAALDTRLPHDLRAGDAGWEGTVAPILAEVFAGLTVAAIMRKMVELGVPATPVQPFKEFALAAAEHEDRIVNRFDDAKWGPLVGLNELIDFEAPGWRPLGGAPLLGQHNDERPDWPA